MPNVELNGSAILVAIAVIVIIAEVITAIAKGKKSLGELSGKDRRQAEIASIRNEIKSVKERLTECENRLSKGDENFEQTREDLKHILDTQNAMLLHFISGNDKENLKRVKEAVDSYLSSR